VNAIIAATSSRDGAYGALKAWILEGRIPLGMRLAEERIAEQLGVSRTPVREALLRLAAEHFLERHPEGGFRVANPTARSVRELYELRCALELFSLRRVVEGVSPEGRDALDDLRAEWLALAAERPEVDPDFVLLDEDFHRRLAEVAGNDEIGMELRRVGERIRPVRTHDFTSPGRIEATVVQHLAILDATLAQRWDAVELLEAHILESQRSVEAVVGLVLERMLLAGGEGLPW
jgi:DNA-binding GntR family transcriptional regulator